MGNREDPDPENAALWDYDANDRIQASPGRSYSFDADGNVATVTEGGVVASFGFDAANRLESYAQGGVTTSYAYDPFGRRIRKTVGGEATWFLWDGDRLLAEYDDVGNRTARYAYAEGFAPRQFATGSPTSETIHDVHADHLDTRGR